MNNASIPPAALPIEQSYAVLQEAFAQALALELMVASKKSEVAADAPDLVNRRRETSRPKT